MSFSLRTDRLTVAAEKPVSLERVLTEGQQTPESLARFASAMVTDLAVPLRCKCAVTALRYELAMYTEAH